jgi:hypothetical protein
MNKQVGYVSPRSFGWWEKLKGLSREPGITVLKGSDGARYMFIITSNSYKDREAEFITSQALERYVEKAWIADDVCKTDNALKFWHDDPTLPLPDIGEIVWADMEGPFLIEVGKEAPNTWAKSVFDYREAHPDEKWGASHGFYYEEKRINPGKGEATYDEIDKFETSILPLSAAANAFTFSGVVSMKSRDAVIEKILGEGAIEKMRQGVQDRKRTLDKQGLEHKSLADKGVLENLAGELDKFLSRITDQAVDDAIKQEFLGMVTALLTPTTTEPEAAAEEEMTALEPEVAKSVSFVELIDTLVTTQETQAHDIAALDKSIKDLGPLTTLAAALNGLRTEIQSVAKDVNALKAAKAGQPRIASQDAKTVVTDKKMVDEANKQLETFDSFWGTRIVPGGQ